jgi:hypothetical protein
MWVLHKPQTLYFYLPSPFLGITQRKKPKKQPQPPSFVVKDEAWGFLFYKFDHNLQVETNNLNLKLKNLTQIFTFCFKVLKQMMFHKKIHQM